MHLLSRQRDNVQLTQWRVWLGGLFFPSAYLTATRQAVAQAKGWSLDDLAVEVIVGALEAKDDQCFTITGLTVEGAAWNTSEAVSLFTHEQVFCPLVSFFAASCIRLTPSLNGTCALRTMPYFVFRAVLHIRPQCLDVTQTLASNLPPMVMRWYHKADGCKFKQAGVTYISTPLFLNRARK